MDRCLATLAGVVQWRYKDWNRPQIPWHFTAYSQTLLEFSLAYLNQTNSVPKTIISTCIFTVDQLMWRTIVHHIPRWREQSLLRDFMRLLWPFTLVHMKGWACCCMRDNAHSVILGILKWSAECGGRLRGMWWTPRNVNTRDVADDFLPLTQTLQKTGCQLMKNQTILKAN